MIQGVSRGESERAYREVMLDSSSSLKDFSMDRKKYYRKYIANDDVEDEDTQASVMGRIVETLLWQKELFDSKFYMSACAAAPTALGLKFVEALYRRTKEATDDDGNINKSFEDISRLAYADAGYKISYENVIKKFVGSDDEIYYNEIRTVRANHLTVVTPKDITNAEAIVEGLKISSVTRDIVTKESSARWTVKNQLQIEGFEIMDHKLKSMLDLLIADNEEKTLQIYDLKCTWSVENFYEEYYLYRRAYIQAYVYLRAVMFLTKDPNGEFFGYRVLSPRFIVCDSINYYSPLIYTMSMKDIDDAYVGFEHRGRRYPGVRAVLLDLVWALENGIWNISRENYENNGVVNIKG